MSWNGTVRCSHCREPKHNRASCPRLKEIMETRLKDNPMDWRALEYFEKKEQRKERTCAYCKGSGHNRKTCVEVQQDRETFIVKNKRLRISVLNWLKEEGLGIGTIVELNSWNKQGPALVNDLAWENISIAKWRRESPTRDEISQSSVEIFRCLMFGAEFDPSTCGYRVEPNELKVISAIDTRSIQSQVPSGWLESKDKKTLKRVERYLRENDMRYNRYQNLCIKDARP